jgi:hypothetical protein
MLLLLLVSLLRFLALPLVQLRQSAVWTGCEFPWVLERPGVPPPLPPLVPRMQRNQRMEPQPKKRAGRSSLTLR